MAHGKVTWQVWIRRFCQSGFLLLFLYIFLQAEYRPVNETGHFVKLFFQMDPLILISSWLSSHQVLSGLLFSLFTLGATVLIGRWFCGWICPFGALHNLFTSLRNQKAKAKLAVDGYSKGQKAKYYILVAILVGAVLGINLAGWLDPFSFFYRSMAVVVNPAVNDGVGSFFGLIYQADPGIGTHKVATISEPIYDFLRHHVLATTQPYFYGSVLIALLFLAVVFLNLYRARFWCRYICPLGALLGVAGKNPLVQIKRNEEACNNCRLCVIDCQGGADPDVKDGWKPSECFYCWNCQSSCPHNVISFGFHVPGGQK
jgi:polyferredoxin